MKPSDHVDIPEIPKPPVVYPDDYEDDIYDNGLEAQPEDDRD